MKYKCDVTQNISNNDVWTHMVQCSTRQQNIKDPSGWCDGQGQSFTPVQMCLSLQDCKYM